MELPDEVVEDVRKRLHRVSGQLAGIERMLDEAEGAHDWLRVVRMRTSLVMQRSAASEIHRLFLGAMPWHLPHPLRLIPDIDRICFQITHADDIASAYAAAVTGDATGPFNDAAEPVMTAATVSVRLRERLAHISRNV